MDTELLASCSSTSMRFLFPRVVCTLWLLDAARVTVTRDDGLGDSFSLERNTVTKEGRKSAVTSAFWVLTFLLLPPKVCGRH